MDASYVLEIVSSVQALLAGDTNLTSTAVSAEVDSLVKELTEEVGQVKGDSCFTIMADVILYNGESVAMFLPSPGASRRAAVETALLDIE